MALGVSGMEVCVQMNRMNVLILLEKLENMVKSAPQVPLTGKAIVDADEVVELVNKIRSVFPEEVRKAEHLTEERDKIVEESQKRAQRIVAAAEEHAAALVQESEIVKSAKIESERILREARESALELENGAKEYARETLEELRKTLAKVLVTIENGQKELSKQQ